MDCLQPLSEVPASHRSETKRVRKQLISVPLIPADDNAFWLILEEREEGRATQEADHLFDTSFDCLV